MFSAPTSEELPRKGALTSALGSKGTRADSHDGPAQVDGCAAPVHGVVQDAEREHGHSGLLEDPEVVACKQGGQEGGSQPGCPIQREVCRH